MTTIDSGLDWVRTKRDGERRIMVLISGTGSNLVALLNSIPELPITHVLANNTTALTLGGAQAATTKGCSLASIVRKGSGLSRDSYDRAIAQKVLAGEPDIVVCAGWMHVFGDEFLTRVDAAGVKVINLHPALPGTFVGKDAIGMAYEAFEKGECEKTGAMVHFVIKEVDRGEPIVWREVEMRKGESVDELRQRIHVVEWEIIVEATRKVLASLS